MMAFKLILVFIGSALAVNGLARIWWEMWSWAVLARLELRPAVFEGRPHRVVFGIHVLTAAVGMTVLTAGVIL